MQGARRGSGLGSGVRRPHWARMAGCGRADSTCRERECFTWNTPSGGASEGCRCNPQDLLVFPLEVHSFHMKREPASTSGRYQNHGCQFVVRVLPGRSALRADGTQIAGYPHDDVPHRVRNGGPAAKHSSHSPAVRCEHSNHRTDELGLLVASPSVLPHTRAAHELNAASPSAFHVKHGRVCHPSTT